MMTKSVIPMHLKANGAVYGHDLGLIGLWPHSPVEQAKLRALWGQECRIWADGDGEIVGVEKAE